MADAIHTQCLKSVERLLRNLKLPYLHDSEIAVRKSPSDGDYLYPGITVQPVAPVEGRGTNARDDIGNAIRLTLVKTSSGDLYDNIAPQLLWMERIRKHFNHQPLAGVPEVRTCTVQVDEQFDAKSFRNGNDASSMTILCWSRESRDT